MRNIDKIKEHCKLTAKQIKKTRFEFREAQRQHKNGDIGSLRWKLDGLKYEYRHHHIAYCELRGRTRDQIEQKVNDDNHPNESYINELKATFAWTPEEIKTYNERMNQHEIIHT